MIYYIFSYGSPQWLSPSPWGEMRLAISNLRLREFLLHIFEKPEYSCVILLREIWSKRWPSCKVYYINEGTIRHINNNFSPSRVLNVYPRLPVARDFVRVVARPMLTGFLLLSAVPLQYDLTHIPLLYRFFSTRISKVIVTSLYNWTQDFWIKLSNPLFYLMCPIRKIVQSFTRLHYVSFTLRLSIFIFILFGIRIRHKLVRYFFHWIFSLIFSYH